VTLVRLIVTSVPARLKVYLRSHAIIAVCPPHKVALLGRARAVKASEADTLCHWSTLVSSLAVCHRLRIRRSSGAISRKHLESRREWLNIGPVLAAAEIVHNSAAIGNQLKAAIRMLIEELWCPVRRLVVLNLAGAASRSL
jgi:hypothetical protein